MRHESGLARRLWQTLRQPPVSAAIAQQPPRQLQQQPPQHPPAVACHSRHGRRVRQPPPSLAALLGANDPCQAPWRRATPAKQRILIDSYLHTFCHHPCILHLSQLRAWNRQQAPINPDRLGPPPGWTWLNTEPPWHASASTDVTSTTTPIDTQHSVPTMSAAHSNAIVLDETQPSVCDCYAWSRF
jgi:hypothetical protein